MFCHWMWLIVTGGAQWHNEAALRETLIHIELNGLHDCRLPETLFAHPFFDIFNIEAMHQAFNIICIVSASHRSKHQLFLYDLPYGWVKCRTAEYSGLWRAWLCYLDNVAAQMCPYRRWYVRASPCYYFMISKKSYARHCGLEAKDDFLSISTPVTL